MAITEGQILDLLTAAAREHRIYGNADRALFSLTQNERIAFDLFLVRTRDPLAWEAGKVEYRFRERVRRMAEAYGRYVANQ